MVPALQPLLLANLVAAVTYALGARRRRLIVGRPPPYERRRAAAFVLALVLVELALCPPFDRLAHESLAAHMVQHVALIGFAPPLLVLAAPWLTIWRGLPLEVRRLLARGVMRLPAVVRRGLRGTVAPWPAWVLLNVDLAVWHVPRLYDLTLRSEAVHHLEHVTFLGFGRRP